MGEGSESPACPQGPEDRHPSGPAPLPAPPRTDRAIHRCAAAPVAPPPPAPSRAGSPAAHLARDLVQRVVLRRQPLPVGEPLAPRALRAHVHRPRRPLLPRGSPLPLLLPLSGQSRSAPPSAAASWRQQARAGDAGTRRRGGCGPGAQRHAVGWRGHGARARDHLRAGGAGLGARRHAGAMGTRVLGLQSPAGTPGDVDRGAGTSEEEARGHGTGDLRGRQGPGAGERQVTLGQGLSGTSSVEMVGGLGWPGVDGAMMQGRRGDWGWGLRWVERGEGPRRGQRLGEA